MILKKSKWAGKLLKQEITEMKAEIKALKKTENYANSEYKPSF